MFYATIQKLRNKLYFTVEDVAEILKIRRGSAMVLCSRYAKGGIFIRLKNNFYVLEEGWERLSKDEFMEIANYLQVPSYISCMSALSAYEVTTQVQRNFYESVSLKRSRRFEVKGAIFNFFKIKKELYFDFLKQGSFFIASKEKALVDALYLYSFGKYKLDFASLDLAKIDKNKIRLLLKKYPQRTKTIAKTLCKI